MPDLLYTKEAQERIRSSPHNLQAQLKEAIERLAAHPELGKALTGHLAGKRSYRTGDYRILYQIDSHRRAVLVLTIGHRKDVYKKR